MPGFEQLARACPEQLADVVVYDKHQQCVNRSSRDLGLARTSQKAEAMPRSECAHQHILHSSNASADA